MTGGGAGTPPGGMKKSAAGIGKATEGGGKFAKISHPFGEGMAPGAKLPGSLAKISHPTGKRSGKFAKKADPTAEISGPIAGISHPIGKGMNLANRVNGRLHRETAGFARPGMPTGPRQAFAARKGTL